MQDTLENSNQSARSLVVRIIAASGGVIVMLLSAAALTTNFKGTFGFALPLFLIGLSGLGWSFPRSEAERKVTRSVDDEYLYPSGYLRMPCPCCGSPTLNQELDITACLICEWDTAPNPAQQPSLPIARDNVRRYLWVYSPDSLPEWRSESPREDELEIKLELLEQYGRIKAAGELAEVELWPHALALEAELRDYDIRRISELANE
jgi:hypothetical protein